jgi:autotransporter-associated beta strand protein
MTSLSTRIPPLSRLCVLLALVFAGPAHGGATLYAFGTAAGDASLAKGDDASQYVDLTRAGVGGASVQLPLFSKTYGGLYVNTNGLMSFGDAVYAYTPQRFPASFAGIDMIAPFWADADTRASGNVWYRISTDGAFLKSLSQDVKAGIPGVVNFTPTFAQVVTWDQVGAYSLGTVKNTYQMVLVSDGTQTYTVFKYPDGGIKWLRGSANDPQSIASAGYGIDGHNYNILPGASQTLSGVSQTLTSGSGTFQFKLDSSTPTATVPVFTWNAASGSGTWSAAVNWRGGSAPGGASNLAEAVFGGSGGTVTLDALRNVRKMSVNSSGYTFTSALTTGANSLTVGTLSTAAADTAITFGGTLILVAQEDGNGNGALRSGRLTFTDSSILGAQYASSVDGASIFLKKNAQLQIYTLNATTRNSTLVFDNTAGATGGTLDLRGLSTVLGGVSSVGAGAGLIKNSLTAAGGLTLDFDSGTQNFSGAIQGNLSLTKVGNGTQVLSGANTYTGGTTLAGGTLGLGSAAALGSSGTIKFSGGTLQYSAGNATDYSSRFSTAAGQAYKLDTNGRDVAVGTALSSSGGSLTKSGAGTLTLNAVNTYSGATTINGGTLGLGRANALSSSTTLSVGTGAGFAMNGFAQTVQGLSGSGTVALGAARLTVNNSGANAYAGVISGSGGLTKNGAGLLTLSGVNSYGGATNVNAGEVKINGSAAGSAFNVAAGATLSGNGGIGALNLSGTLAPGNSPGKLTAGDTAFAAGSTYLWEINSATGAAGVAYDTLQVNGVLGIAAGASPVTISLRSLMADNSAGAVYDFDGRHSYSYTLISTTGGISGYASDRFLLDASGFSNALNDGAWSLSLAGNDLRLNFTAAAVPEPAGYVLLLGGLALVGGAARRRRNPQA